MSEDVFPIYQALWRRAEAEGVFVGYVGVVGNGEAGYFHSREDPVRKRKPMIAITRPYYKSPGNEPTRESNAPSASAQPDLRAELFTLAHEYGHFRSWAGRTERVEWDAYTAVAVRRDELTKQLHAESPDADGPTFNARLREAMQTKLSADDRDRIVREETLAWDIGREVLAELGLGDFHEYDERARNGLHNHRYRLGMDDLWPGDR